MGTKSIVKKRGIEMIKTIFAIVLICNICYSEKNLQVATFNEYIDLPGLSVSKISKQEINKITNTLADQLDGMCFGLGSLIGFNIDEPSKYVSTFYGIQMASGINQLGAYDMLISVDRYQNQIFWIDNNLAHKKVLANPCGMDKYYSEIRYFGGLGSSSGQFNSPTKIVTDYKGSYWICDVGNNRIVRLNYNAATLSWEWMGSIEGILSIADCCYANEALYIASRNQLLKINDPYGLFVGKRMVNNIPVDGLKVTPLSFTPKGIALESNGQAGAIVSNRMFLVDNNKIYVYQENSSISYIDERSVLNDLPNIDLSLTDVKTDIYGDIYLVDNNGSIIKYSNGYAQNKTSGLTLLFREGQLGSTTLSDVIKLNHPNSITVIGTDIFITEKYSDLSGIQRFKNIPIIHEKTIKLVPNCSEPGHYSVTFLITKAGKVKIEVQDKDGNKMGSDNGFIVVNGSDVISVESGYNEIPVQFSSYVEADMRYHVYITAWDNSDLIKNSDYKDNVSLIGSADANTNSLILENRIFNPANSSVGITFTANRPTQCDIWLINKEVLPVASSSLTEDAEKNMIQVNKTGPYIVELGGNYEISTTWTPDDFIQNKSKYEGKEYKIIAHFYNNSCATSDDGLVDLSEAWYSSTASTVIMDATPPAGVLSIVDGKKGICPTSSDVNYKYISAVINDYHDATTVTMQTWVKKEDTGEEIVIPSRVILNTASNATTYAWNGKHETGVVFPQGAYKIKVQLKDAANNISEYLSETFILDISGPTITAQPVGTIQTSTINVNNCNPTGTYSCFQYQNANQFIINITATDNSDEVGGTIALSAKFTRIFPTPKGIPVEILKEWENIPSGEVRYCGLDQGQPGIYEIRIVATDEFGNTSAPVVRLSGYPNVPYILFDKKRASLSFNVFPNCVRTGQTASFTLVPGFDEYETCIDQEMLMNVSFQIPGESNWTFPAGALWHVNSASYSTPIQYSWIPGGAVPGHYVFRAQIYDQFARVHEQKIDIFKDVFPPEIIVPVNQEVTADDIPIVNTDLHISGVIGDPDVTNNGYLSGFERYEVYFKLGNHTSAAIANPAADGWLSELTSMNAKIYAPPYRQRISETAADFPESNFGFDQTTLGDATLAYFEKGSIASGYVTFLFIARENNPSATFGDEYRHVLKTVSFQTTASSTVPLLSTVSLDHSATSNVTLDGDLKTLVNISSSLYSFGLDEPVNIKALILPAASISGAFPVNGVVYRKDFNNLIGDETVEFDWDGRDMTGTMVPNGNYKVLVFVEMDDNMGYSKMESQGEINISCGISFSGLQGANQAITVPPEAGAYGANIFTVNYKVNKDCYSFLKITSDLNGDGIFGEDEGAFYTKPSVNASGANITHLTNWDGLDQLGVQVAPGVYRIYIIGTSTEDLSGSWYIGKNTDQVSNWYCDVTVSRPATSNSYTDATIEINEMPNPTEGTSDVIWKTKAVGKKWEFSNKTINVEADISGEQSITRYLKKNYSITADFIYTKAKFKAKMYYFGKPVCDGLTSFCASDATVKSVVNNFNVVIFNSNMVDVAINSPTVLCKTITSSWDLNNPDDESDEPCYNSNGGMGCAGFCEGWTGYEFSQEVNSYGILKVEIYVEDEYGTNILLGEAPEGNATSDWPIYFTKTVSLKDGCDGDHDSDPNEVLEATVEIKIDWTKMRADDVVFNTSEHGTAAFGPIHRYTPHINYSILAQSSIDCISGSGLELSFIKNGFPTIVNAIAQKENRKISVTINTPDDGVVVVSHPIQGNPMYFSATNPSFDFNESNGYVFGSGDMYLEWSAFTNALEVDDLFPVAGDGAWDYDGDGFCEREEMENASGTPPYTEQRGDRDFLWDTVRVWQSGLQQTEIIYACMDLPMLNYFNQQSVTFSIQNIVPGSSAGYPVWDIDDQTGGLYKEIWSENYTPNLAKINNLDLKFDGVNETMVDGIHLTLEKDDAKKGLKYQIQAHYVLQEAGADKITWSSSDDQKLTFYGLLWGDKDIQSGYINGQLRTSTNLKNIYNASANKPMINDFVSSGDFRAEARRIYVPEAYKTIIGEATFGGESDVSTFGYTYWSELGMMQLTHFGLDLEGFQSSTTENIEFSYLNGDQSSDVGIVEEVDRAGDNFDVIMNPNITPSRFVPILGKAFGPDFSHYTIECFKAPENPGDPIEWIWISDSTNIKGASGNPEPLAYWDVTNKNGNYFIRVKIEDNSGYTKTLYKEIQIGQEVKAFQSTKQVVYSAYNKTKLVFPENHPQANLVTLDLADPEELGIRVKNYSKGPIVNVQPSMVFNEINGELPRLVYYLTRADMVDLEAEKLGDIGIYYLDETNGELKQMPFSGVVYNSSDDEPASLVENTVEPEADLSLNDIYRISVPINHASLFVPLSSKSFVYINPIEDTTINDFVILSGRVSKPEGANAVIKLYIDDDPDFYDGTIGVSKAFIKELQIPDVPVYYWNSGSIELKVGSANKFEGDHYIFAQLIVDGIVNPKSIIPYVKITRDVTPANISLFEVDKTYYSSHDEFIKITLLLEEDGFALLRCVGNEGIEYSNQRVFINGQTLTDVFVPTSVNGNKLAEGTYRLLLNTIDNAGNLSTVTAHNTIYLDYSAPVILSVIPSATVPVSGFNKTQIPLIIEGRDNMLLGGVSVTANANQTVPVDGSLDNISYGFAQLALPVTIGTEMTNSVEITLYDKAGNKTVSTQPILLDMYAPVTTLVHDGIDFGEANGGVPYIRCNYSSSITLAVQDDYQMGYTLFRFDEGSYQQYTGVFLISDYVVQGANEKLTRLDYYSVDNAGLVENVKSQTILLSSNIVLFDDWSGTEYSEPLLGLDVNYSSEEKYSGSRSLKLEVQDNTQSLTTMYLPYDANVRVPSIQSASYFSFAYKKTNPDMTFSMYIDGDVEQTITDDINLAGDDNIIIPHVRSTDWIVVTLSKDLVPELFKDIKYSAGYFIFTITGNESNGDALYFDCIQYKQDPYMLHGLIGENWQLSSTGSDPNAYVQFSTASDKVDLYVDNKGFSGDETGSWSDPVFVDKPFSPNAPVTILPSTELSWVQYDKDKSLILGIQCDGGEWLYYAKNAGDYWTQQGYVNMGAENQTPVYRVEEKFTRNIRNDYYAEFGAYPTTITCMRVGHLNYNGWLGNHGGYIKDIYLGTTLYADAENGSDVTGTGSVTNPYATLEHAYTQIPLQIASPFTIILKPGTYSSVDQVGYINTNRQFTPDNNLTICSQYSDPDRMAVLQRTSSIGPVLIVDVPNVTLKNLKFIGYSGSSDLSALSLSSNNCTVDGCIFLSTQQDPFKRAIKYDNPEIQASLKVVNSIMFFENTASYPVCFDGVPTDIILINNTFTGAYKLLNNSASAVFSSTIYNNIFKNISTVLSNFASLSTININNSVYYNTGSSSSIVSFTNCIEGDPLFYSENVTLDNFLKLRTESPAIDIGNNVIAPDYDLGGAKRPLGEMVDAGAYEYDPSMPTAPSRVYASIGQAYDYSSGSVTLRWNSNSVTGSGTLWRDANRGKGDILTANGKEYTIDTVLTNTSLLLTSRAEVAFTGSVYSIKRKFREFETWSQQNKNLVALDMSEVAILYNDGVPLIGSSIGAWDSWWTTDASHTLTVTAISHNRAYGTANRGATLDCRGYGISTYSHYLTIDGIEIKNMNSEYGLFIAGNHSVVKSCVIHDGSGKGISLQYDNTCDSVYNNIVYNLGTTGIYAGPGNMFIANNTVFNCNIGIDLRGNSNKAYNNILFGNTTADFYQTGTNEYARNVISDNSLPTYATDNQRNQTLSQIAFANTTPGAYDLHIQATSAAKGYGNAYDVSFATDIDGNIRVSPWDAGADQAGGYIPPVLPVHSVPVRYVSIGTKPDYSAGSLQMATGSKIVTGINTAWQANNQGQGDSLLVNGAGYTIDSVTSDTRLVLTQAAPASFSGSYNIKRKFRTFIAWEAQNRDLLLADESEVAVMYNDTACYKTALMDGWHTNVAHTITINAAPGNRHNGVAGTGVVLDAGSHTWTIYASNVSFAGLEVRNLGGAYGMYIGGRENVVRSCLFHDGATNGIHLYYAGSSDSVYNNIIYGFGAAGIDIATTEWNFVANNTVYGCNEGIRCSQGNSSYNHLYVVNNISVGNNADYSEVPGSVGFNANDSNNIAGDNSLVTVGAGPHCLNNITLAQIKFVDVSAVARDLHIRINSAARNAGADLSACFTRDIDNSVRTAGLWDIGAHENTTIDVIAPVIIVTGVSENGLYNNSRTITITVTDDQDPEPVYTATLNNQAFESGHAAADEGFNTLIVSAADWANNTSADTVHFTLDFTPPVVSITALATNDQTPQLQGTIDDNNAVISVTVAGQTKAATNNGDGTWVIADNQLDELAEAIYNVSVSATDPAGNIGHDATTNELTIDITAPVVSVAPEAGEYPAAFFNSDSAITMLFSDNLSGVLSVYYTLNGAEPDNTSTVYTSPLDHISVGTVLKYFAKDHAGNASSIATAIYELAVPKVRYVSVGSRSDEIGGSPSAPLGASIQVTADSKVVTGTGTEWWDSNRGRGDTLIVDGIGYTIDSVVDNTTLAITGNAVVSYTGASYSIKRKYATLQAWAEQERNLVAADENEAAVFYNDGAEFEVNWLSHIDGNWQTDAEHRLVLTADSRNRHQGTAGTGVVINCVAGVWNMYKGNTIIENLEIRNSSGYGMYLAGNDNVVRNCIFRNSQGTGLQVFYNAARDSVYNNIFMDIDSSAIEVASYFWNFLANNTIYGCGKGICLTSGNTATNNAYVVNNICWGNGIDFTEVDGAIGFNANDTNNISADNSILTIGNAQKNTGNVSSVAMGFLSLAQGGLDLHLRKSSMAFNAGADLSTYFTSDIDGNTRSGLWDVGADENVWTDSVAPEIAITGVLNGYAYNTSKQVYASASDAEDANPFMVLTINGSVVQTGHEVSAEGVHTVVVEVWDHAGNTAVDSLAFTIDLTAPTAWASPMGGYHSVDFFNSDSTIVLQASDALSGVLHIYYTTDGSAPTDASSVYSNPISNVPEDLTLKFFARDNSGNNGSMATEVYELEPVSTGPSPHYVSIGTASNYTTGTICISAGSKNVTGSGTAWKTGNRGKGDSLYISGVGGYVIDTVLSETGLKLTRTADAGYSGSDYSIMRKFSTIQGWISTGRNLVSLDQREVALMYKDGSEYARYDIGGSAWVTDSLHTITLAAAPGNRHAGVQGAGVVINCNGAVWNIYKSWVTLDGLEVRNSGGTYGLYVSGRGNVVRSCMFHNGSGHGIHLYYDGSSDSVYNNIIYGFDSVGININTNQWNFIGNNTVYGCNAGIRCSHGNYAYNSMFVVNNIAWGNGVDYKEMPAPAIGFNGNDSNNIAGDSSLIAVGAGPHCINNVLASQIAFSDTSAGTLDLHITDNSAAKDAGAKLNVWFTKDIDGEIRGIPSDSLWDIGADEKR